jgi:hypothetical protein
MSNPDYFALAVGLAMKQAASLKQEVHDGSTITEIEAAVLRAEIHAAGKKADRDL